MVRRWSAGVCLRVGMSPYSRPLGEVALVGDPALVVGGHGVVDVSTPGHVWKHVKQVLQLIRGQCTVPVLDHT